uniref:Amiloride-sensitive cation channel 1, neuronal n=1 Tax=Capra hircus TaxID=9925 RepID=A0A8C2RSS1_CAPHI
MLNTGHYALVNRLRAESPSEGSLQPSSIQIFANTSTLHGIRHIFVYGPLTVRRVLWAVAFVGSLGLLLVESSERVSYYFSYQHVTKVDEVVAQSLVFPAVTLCNLNGFRFSRLTTNDLYHAGELLALLDVNLQIPDPHLADPTVLEALQRKADFKHYRPKQFSMREFLHRVGHDLKDMMLYCKFKGQECGHQDFTTVSTWHQLLSVLGPLEKCHAGGLWLGLRRAWDSRGLGTLWKPSVAASPKAALELLSLRTLSHIAVISSVWQMAERPDSVVSSRLRSSA